MTVNKKFKIIPFIASDYNESGAHANFETDKTKADIPTITLPTVPAWIYQGVINEAAYRLNPTNAETYTFMIFEGAAAGDYHSNSLMLYESAALRADDIDYRVVFDPPRPFRLTTKGTFYIATDWTGVPGVTLGHIRIAGLGYY